MHAVRYKQRFQNYDNSFLLLKASIMIEKPSIIEEAGVIQFFELPFELSWKLLKDYCEFLGFTVNSPREAIKRALSIAMISNGEIWLRTLMDRNLTVHVYDEAIAHKVSMGNEVYETIKDEYFPLLEQLYKKFKDELCLD
ncbi:MAG: nucleotidyltransferase substrate binding protein [Spirochaetes bacterium]|nr:nucleotidyltransferase substrate binding protein [Spirochaetota bacterium]